MHVRTNEYNKQVGSMMLQGLGFVRIVENVKTGLYYEA